MIERADTIDLKFEVREPLANRTNTKKGVKCDIVPSLNSHRHLILYLDKSPCGQRI